MRLGQTKQQIIRMNWKQLMGVVTVAGVSLGAAHGGIVTHTYNWSNNSSPGFANGGSIPDGNPSGWLDKRTLPSSDWVDAWLVTDVKVKLSLAGGYNGDLYAYLVHDTGFSVLLNRVGRGAASESGYATSGFTDLWLSSGAATDVHFNGGASTGSYQPDGRQFDPMGLAAGLGTAPRTAMLSSFNNLKPDGDWSLFIADVSTGSMSTMDNWSLEITAVPEPAVGLVLSGSGLVVGLGWLAVRRHKAK